MKLSDLGNGNAVADLSDNDDERNLANRRKAEFIEREADIDARDEAADAREEGADRRELQIDARELVLDRWERDVAARATASNLLDEVEDHRREQRRLERVVAHQQRRDEAEARRGAAIERDIHRLHRPDPDLRDGPAPSRVVLVASFKQLAMVLQTNPPLGEVLEFVLVAAVDSVPDCAAATVALVTQGRIDTAASTARWAADLNGEQIALGCGPLLTAIAEDLALTADLATDERWPALAGLGRSNGRAAMGFGLRVAGEEAGALTLYSPPGGHFQPEAVAIGEFLAAHAAAALVRSSERLVYEAQTQAWQNALASRDIIGQAKGILMGQHSISGDEAFNLLRQASQQLNLKIRDIALHVIERRQMPSSS